MVDLLEQKLQLADGPFGRETQFQFVHDNGGEVAKLSDLLLGDRTRFPVDDAERPQAMAIPGPERNAGIEPEPKIAGNQRVRQGPRISLRIRKDPWIVVEDCRGAKPRPPGDFIHFESMMRLEPDPIRVNYADD